MPQDKKNTHKFVLSIERYPVNGFFTQKTQSVLFNKMVNFFSKGCDMSGYDKKERHFIKEIEGTEQQCIAEYNDHTKMIIKDTEEFKALIKRSAPRKVAQHRDKIKIGPKSPPFEQLQQFAISFGIDISAEVQGSVGNNENRAAKI
jgi:hypothetical protein